jgi:nicotinamidase-related amidase
MLFILPPLRRSLPSSLVALSHLSPTPTTHHPSVITPFALLGSHTPAPAAATYPLPQGTELLELLQRLGCDTVLVGGVMTNLCCETTAR